MVKAGKISLNSPPVSDDILKGSLKNVRVGSVDAVEPAMLEELQQAVDSGHQPWRLDPVQVAIIDGRKYGLASDDTFRLVSKKFGENAGTYIADVEVKHKDELYTVRLIQPANIGDGGAWIISGIGRGER